MPHYAIGDLQGCYTALEALLSKINYDTSLDTLWFTGDLSTRMDTNDAIVARKEYGLRAAYRVRDHPDVWVVSDGFRCLREVLP